MAGFADQVRNWSEATKAKATLAVRKIALEVFREVIMMTPVDEGRARGNWQCAIGNVPTGVLELDDKSGTATISAMQAVTLGVEAGQIIYLVNSVPYIRALEYGHSKQAPDGMVRKTVQRYQPIVEAVARELNRG